MNPPRWHLGLSGLAPPVVEEHIALPLHVVAPADLVGGSLYNGRRRPRERAPWWAGKMLRSDINGEAAHITHAPMRLPLHRTAQVTTGGANPAPPPARMCGGPARPRARARLRPNRHVGTHRQSALSRSANAPQAPLQLCLGNRPTGGAMSRPRRVRHGAALVTSPVQPRRPLLKAGSERRRPFRCRVSM